VWKLYETETGVLLRHGVYMSAAVIVSCSADIVQYFSVVTVGVCVLWQSRSQTLLKQLQEMHEQIEQTAVEMKTFENLREHEVIAVPKRVEVCISVTANASSLLVPCVLFCVACQRNSSHTHSRNVSFIVLMTNKNF